MASRFENPQGFPGWWRAGFSLIIAGQAMMVSLGLNTTDEPPAFGSLWYIAIHALLVFSALITLVLLGGALFSNFLYAVRRRRLTVEALFVASILGAFVVSLQSTLLGHGPLYYEVISIVLVIYTFGNSLKAHATAEAQNILSRARAAYASAWLRQEGALVRVPVSSLRPDDLVVIKPGEMSTVDGIIVEGQAFVTLASITGEPSAVPFAAGQHLPAGAFSVDGLLTVRVTSTARSIDVIFDSLTAGAPSVYEQLADRVTQWFLPIVAGLALAAFVLWSTFGTLGQAITSAMSILLVACPCALGMATPLAVRSFLFSLSRYGWRGRSGQLVERLARIDTVFFDKTGTLTLADLKITDARWNIIQNLSPTELQGLCACVENTLEQPIARAFAVWQALPGAHLQTLRVHPGQGISAELVYKEKSHTLLIGSEAFAAAQGSWPALPAGKRLVYASLDGQCAGVIALSEEPRAQMYQLLQTLLGRGLRVEVLTGDSAPQVDFPTGVTVHAGLSPQDKAVHVTQAQAQGRAVLFVGDGINDTLAMNAAHASLALAEGAALGHAAATAVVSGPGLEALPQALTLAQKASRVLGWNLRFAAYYNFLGMGLALLGVLHPVVASVLMLGSSAVVAWRAVGAAERAA